MIRVIPRVLLLHPDQAFRERVRRACAGRYELCEVGDWQSLRNHLRSAPPSTIVLVDPRAGADGRAPLAVELRVLLREFPSATVLAGCAIRPGCLEDVRTLGEWGVSRIVCVDEEDTPLAVARTLLAAQGRPLRSLLHESLPASMSGRGRAIVMSAADVVAAGGLGRDLARSLHVAPRTLQRWCRRAGIPVPRELLAWMRLLLAAELLDDPGRSVLGVALACGYSSDAALRNAFRAYLSLSPAQLKREGAFRLVSARFLEALGDAQEGARSVRSPDGLTDGRGADVIPIHERMPRGVATRRPAAPRAAAEG